MMFRPLRMIFRPCINIPLPYSSFVPTSYNGKEFDYAKISEGIAEQSEEFLKSLDNSMTTIAGWVEGEIKADFPSALRKFNVDLNKRLTEFDKNWCVFEQLYLKAKQVIDTDVLDPVHTLVDIEKNLQGAEDSSDWGKKQTFENQVQRWAV